MDTVKGEKSLKSQIFPWLVSLAVFDVVAISALVFGESFHSDQLTHILAKRAGLVSILPVAVLLISGFLSHNVKAAIVFWKLKNILPGHEAFSRHGPADPRINLKTLEKKVGRMPSVPAEQNGVWYGLYKEVERDTRVSEAQRLYLMYRDMAAVSLLISVLVPIILYALGALIWQVLAVLGLFVGQYFLTAVSARHAGIRFVNNVLAIHSTSGKTSASKPPTPKKGRVIEQA